MDKHYKKLMNNRKTLAARFVDSMFILLVTTIIVFGYCVIKLRNLSHSIIITLNIDIIILLLMSKMQNIHMNHFKESLNAKIREKLILEQIVFSRGKDIEIAGYTRVGDREYISKDGRKAMLLTLYPESVLTPKELLEHIDVGYEEIIASCKFDDDCYLLCSRMGIELYDREFLLKNTELNIDDERIEHEIEEEVKKISEIKNKRKRTSFARERWSRYLLSCLLLFAASGFMGRFRIIYIAFGGMCMSFCFISLFVSKSQ